MKRLAATVLSMFLSTAVVAGGVHVIHYDGGGSVSEYNERWSTYARELTRVVIDGDCVSACGRFMTLPNVCATSRGYFYLHGITVKYDDGRVAVDPAAGEADSRKWESPRAFRLQKRYDVFSYGFVDQRPAREVALEPGVSIVYKSVGLFRFQKFLRVKATLLVPRCVP